MIVLFEIKSCLAEYSFSCDRTPLYKSCCLLFSQSEHDMGEAPSFAPVSLNLVSANGGSVMSSSHVSKKNVRIQEISTPACVLQVA